MGIRFPPPGPPAQAMVESKTESDTAHLHTGHFKVRRSPLARVVAHSVPLGHRAFPCFTLCGIGKPKFDTQMT